MSFCSNCGIELKEHVSFCKKCGTQVQANPTEQAPQDGQAAAMVTASPPNNTPDIPAIEPLPSKDSTRSNPSDSGIHQAKMTEPRPVVKEAIPVEGSQPRSKRRMPMIIAIAALALVILLAGGYKFGQYWFSEERVIHKFEKAMEHKDGKVLAGLLTSEDSRLVLSEQKTTGFIAYLDANPTAAEEIVSGLRKQKFIEKNGDKDSLYDGQTVRLVKSRKLLFFHEYKLAVKPVFIKMKTNYKGVQLLIDGQEVMKTKGENEENEFGPYLPGIYHLEAKLKTDYIELSSEQDASLWGEAREYAAPLDLQGEQIEIHTGLEQSGLKGRLFINGHDVGVNPFETTTFGPLKTDGSIKLAVEADYPWGTTRTNDITIDGSSVEVQQGNADSLQATLMDMAVQFEREWLDGYTSGDVQKLKTGTKIARAALQGKIDQARQQGLSEIAMFTGTTFDLGSFHLGYIDGQWKASGTLIAHFMRASFLAGNVPPQELSEDGEGQDVLFIYDESAKVWRVDSFQNFYDSFELSDQLKEVKEQDPKTYRTADNSALSAVAKDGNSTDIGAFLLQYLSTSVDAINARDFTLVSGMLDEAGPSYKESSSYIKYLEGKGITEQLTSSQVNEIQHLDDNSYEVSTSESYDITYKDGTTKSKSFKSTYRIVLINGAPLVNKLISTKEQ